MSEQTEFGKLIDGTPEEFREHCSDKNLGYVQSLRNQIAGAYQTLVQMKEDLVKKIKEESLPEDSKETVALKGIYAELIKLEGKASICVQLIKERELKD